MMRYWLFLLLVSQVSWGMEEAAVPAPQSWSFNGPFGTFDRAAAQRGFQVYKEVCATCHGMDLVHYRDLEALGFSKDEVKAIAAQYEVQDGPNDDGDMFQRPGEPKDAFVSPYKNEKAARAANGGAFPVDLSLVAKGRKHGPDYLYALLTGYADAPQGVLIFEGKHYNPYFPGGQISMPPPLQEGLVTYADGTKSTVDQMARDVSHFLMWTAEPKLEDRHQTGVKALIFLAILTGLLYALKRRIWRRVKK